MKEIGDVLAECIEIEKSLQARIVELEGQVGQYFVDLEIYGKHRSSCDYYTPISAGKIALPCSCGLDKELSGKSCSLIEDLRVTVEALEHNAIEFVNKYYPLPRCSHGNALRDGAYENLEPDCGCRMSKPIQL